MNKRYFVIAGIICLILFTFFSRYIKKGGFKNADFDTTVRLQSKIPVIERIGGDEFWEDASFFVSPPISIVIILLLTLLAAIQEKSWKRKFFSLAIPILFAFMIGAEVYGKSVVHHPAPPFFMLKNPTTIFPKYHIQEDFSYPSGHMSRVTYFAVFSLVLLLQNDYLFAKMSIQKYLSNHWNVFMRNLTILGIFLYFIIIAIGKIYLGHHWLSDMIGGGLLGLGFGLVGVSLIIKAKV